MPKRQAIKATVGPEPAFLDPRSCNRARPWSPGPTSSADPRFCGTLVELGEGSARVALDAIDSMVVDAQGLVHGGFVFGLADYAAMLAVNDPNVVLGAAETRFLKPVRRGDRA